MSVEKNNKTILTRLGEIKCSDKERKQSVLLVAAKEGNLSLVKELLHTGVSQITEKNSKGDTALLVAAAAGQLSTVEWLLKEGGAKVTEKNAEGDTALLLAAAKGHVDTLAWLLQEEKTPLIKSSSTYSALLAAAAKGQLATVQWLLSKGGAEDYNETALTLAMANGKFTVVSCLLEYQGYQYNNGLQEISPSLSSNSSVPGRETVLFPAHYFSSSSFDYGFFEVQKKEQKQKGDENTSTSVEDTTPGKAH